MERNKVGFAVKNGSLSLTYEDPNNFLQLIFSLHFAIKKKKIFEKDRPYIFLILLYVQAFSARKHRSYFLYQRP